MTVRGTPPASFTLSGKVTQYGNGIMTSSPGLMMVCRALKMTFLEPEPTIIFSGPTSYANFFGSFLLFSLSFKMPGTRVTRTSGLMLCLVASITTFGVGSSGSPTFKLIIVLPSDLNLSTADARANVYSSTDRMRSDML